MHSYFYESDFTKISEIKIARYELGEVLGKRWPVFLLQSLRLSRKIFKDSKWGGKNTPESEFVKRISLGVALYRKLGEKIGKEQALKKMHKILGQIGVNEQRDNAAKMSNGWPTEFSRLNAFHRLMDEKGGPRFNTRIFKRNDNEICHFVITRCVFYDFFKSVNAPELTQIFCEVDREFFTSEFSTIKFHRNGSWENTIAFGAQQCEFVFES